MKKYFLSIGSALVFMAIFAIACAVATFVESANGTQAAWEMVYGAWWFAFVQVVLGVNLAYNIYAYKLFSLKKLPALIFHFSFIFILIGAGMTRYLGYEGIMHIRQGQVQDSIITSEQYIGIRTSDENSTFVSSIPKIVSENVKFDIKLNMGSQTATLKSVGFVPNAVYEWIESKDGVAIIEINFSNNQHSRSISLKQGQSVEVGDISFAFDDNATQKKFVLISLKDGKFSIKTNQKVNYMDMGSMKKAPIAVNSEIPLKSLGIYSIEGLNFSIQNMFKSAKKVLQSADEHTRGYDAIIASVEYKGKSKQIEIFNTELPSTVEIEGQIFECFWSPMKINLPFSVQLDRFQIDRYPGSNSPMSYSSYVKVIDQDSEFDYHIYMNHVLDYKGYRFFQSSYDKDELGTVLSVNKDPGKYPTYFGYFLLFLGLFLNVLNPNSRFAKLSKLLKNSNISWIIGLVMLFGVSTAHAQYAMPTIDAKFAKEASTLIIQDAGGRMKPFDTLSHEILNKLYRSDNYKGMDANSVILSMMVNADYWRNIGVIRIKDKEVREILGLGDGQKYASFSDFFDSSGMIVEYKLLKQSELANRKAPAARSTFDKEVIKADEKLNILYMVFMGEFFRVMPKQMDENNAWYSPAAAITKFSGEELKKAEDIFQDFFNGILTSQKSGNWTIANQALKNLKQYQVEFGSEIVPSDRHVKFELLFNKLQIFKNLTSVYLLAGLVLLVAVFARIAHSKLRLNLIFKIVYGVNILAFVAHTIGLGLRWYIAQHAPWSDSYESMVYIAWALALSGIVFSKKSDIALALTAILAGITLFVAHLSWIDPQITTLVPVLKSYWLTIHVSVITASYGFLGLCSLLGLFSLILFALQGKSENQELSKNILEAVRINEMAMILGLSLLIVGNFLGGIWANESWGRYWGWDSKETWSLISILVYSVVLHMRFVPKLNSQIYFCIASAFAYWAIIMTYFGVNFYLTGMHSYAAGDPAKVPNFVIVICVAMIILSIVALRNKKYSRSL